jgi:hypothetical protein
MKARIFCACPIPPASTIAVTKWYWSKAGYLVLLKFIDQSGVTWIGPEFPLNLASSAAVDAKDDERRFSVAATTIDTIQGWTDFTLEERR